MIDSLYVHIPFCLQKCLYCDFNSYADNVLEDSYIDALIMELSIIDQTSFNTIFVGGGTPTILSIQNLERLLKALNSFKALEYTFECNPGTLSTHKLTLLKKYGVNRLSIGLQALQDSLLKKLGRIHNINQFMESYRNAREIGFNNINIDLMFGIPDQKLSDWEDTLNRVMDLKPEHISSYGLIIEEGTPYSQMHSRGELNLVNEDIEREMYYIAENKLKNNGYEHYEISNFSLKGLECKHNITYWESREYYGVGAGAHSYINNERYSNYSGIEDYIKNMNLGSAIEAKELLTLNDKISEFMFLGLRMLRGISKEVFYTRFGVQISEVFGDELKYLIANRLLEEEGENIRLTKRGIDVSNQIFVRFLK